MNFKDYRAVPPEPGTRILAFNPVYVRGDPMRFRVLTQPLVPLSEVNSYMTADDLEDAVRVDPSSVST